VDDDDDDDDDAGHDDEDLTEDERDIMFAELVSRVVARKEFGGAVPKTRERLTVGSCCVKCGAACGAMDAEA